MSTGRESNVTFCYIPYTMPSLKYTADVFLQSVLWFSLCYNTFIDILDSKSANQSIIRKTFLPQDYKYILLIKNSHSIFQFPTDSFQVHLEFIFLTIVVSALHEILALSWGELPCSGSHPLSRSSVHPMTDPCIVHFLPTSVLDTQLQRLHLGLAKATETKLQPSFFLAHCCFFLIPLRY